MPGPGWPWATIGSPMRYFCWSAKTNDRSLVGILTTSFSRGTPMDRMKRRIDTREKSPMFFAGSAWTNVARLFYDWPRVKFATDGPSNGRRTSRSKCLTEKIRGCIHCAITGAIRSFGRIPSVSLRRSARGEKRSRANPSATLVGWSKRAVGQEHRADGNTCTRSVTSPENWFESMSSWSLTRASRSLRFQMEMIFNRSIDDDEKRNELFWGINRWEQWWTSRSEKKNSVGLSLSEQRRCFDAGWIAGERAGWRYFFTKPLVCKSWQMFEQESIADDGRVLEPTACSVPLANRYAWPNVGTPREIWSGGMPKVRRELIGQF